MLHCFMCKNQDLYKKDDLSSIEGHLKIEHRITHDVSFLVAGWFMTTKEKESVKDLIFNKNDIFFEEIVMDMEEIEDFDVISTDGLDVKLEQDDYKETLEDYMVNADDSDNLEEANNVDTLQGKLVRQKSKGYKGKTMPIIVGSDEVPGKGRVCRICGIKFFDSANMSRHFKDVHQPKEHPCQGCGKIYSSYNKYLSHYSRYCGKIALGKSLTGEFPCKMCLQIFKTESSRIVHYATCKMRTSPRKRSILKVNHN